MCGVCHRACTLFYSVRNVSECNLFDDRCLTGGQRRRHTRCQANGPYPRYDWFDNATACAVTAVLVWCYYSLDKELFAPNSRRVVTRVRTTGNNLAAEWAYRAPDWLVASGFSYSSRAESSSDCICVAHIAWTLILTMLTAQCSHSPVQFFCTPTLVYQRSRNCLYACYD